MTKSEIANSYYVVFQYEQNKSIMCQQWQRYWGEGGEGGRRGEGEGGGGGGRGSSPPLFDS